ncbi:MAG: transporter substrate-binding domain-containing protein [Lentisphaerae bacterium]|nr:transporter substrate-binding domain-containing protein [Lentisphaerota bacterium]
MKKYVVFAILFALLLPLASAEKNVLRMVTSADFPPYEFYSGSKIVGIDADIIREIAKRNDHELVIEDMKFDSIIAAIQSGKGDIAASGLSVTEDRKKKVDFSVSYVTAKQVIIVPKNSPIRTPEDLKNKKIGVQHGTTGDTYVTENLGEPQRFDNGSTAVVALLRNKIDAVVLDGEPALVHAAKNPDLLILEKLLTEEEYAFAVAKGRKDLLDMINRTLKEMQQDGSLQKIVLHYLAPDVMNDSGNSPVSTPKETSFVEGLQDDLYLNFVKDQRWKYLVNGFYITMTVALAAVILGVAIGFLVAIIRSTADLTGGLTVSNFLCKVYLTVIRGTPVVLQLLIIYFVVFGSIDVNKVVVAIIAFGINSGAYVAEIIRSGIMSIDRGQMEAGRSLGLSYFQSMRLVILPQALKNVLPALGNEFIVLLKETSVCGFIALQDLTKGGDIIRSQTYNAFLPLIAVALIYLFLVMIFSYGLQMLEKRLKKNEK